MAKRIKLKKDDVDFLIKLYADSKEICDRVEKILRIITDKNIKVLLNEEDIN